MRNKNKTNEIEEPHISGSLLRHGYKWLDITIDNFADEFASKLNIMEAKVWRMDVYSSADKLYRNYVIRYKLDGHIREISIMYELDKPSRISIRE